MLMARKFSFSSIKKYLAGITFFMKINGNKPISHNCIINQSLKGYRMKFTRVDTHTPITLDILRKIYNILTEICSSANEVMLFRAAFVLSFLAALRVSELVVANKYLASKLFRLEIICNDRSITFLIRSSKTDQLFKGVWLNINAISGLDLCPFKTMSEFLSIRPEYVGILFLLNRFCPNTNSMWCQKNVLHVLI